MKENIRLAAQLAALMAIVYITMFHAIPQWADSLPPSPNEQVITEVNNAK